MRSFGGTPSGHGKTESRRSCTSCAKSCTAFWTSMLTHRLPRGSRSPQAHSGRPAPPVSVRCQDVLDSSLAERSLRDVEPCQSSPPALRELFPCDFIKFCGHGCLRALRSDVRQCSSYPCHSSAYLPPSLSISPVRRKVPRQRYGALEARSNGLRHPARRPRRGRRRISVRMCSWTIR